MKRRTGAGDTSGVAVVSLWLMYPSLAGSYIPTTSNVVHPFHDPGLAPAPTNSLDAVKQGASWWLQV